MAAHGALGGAVLSQAIINIVGNTTGLERSLGESRRQLHGFLTMAQVVGGRFGGLLANMVAIRGVGGRPGALTAIDDAMQRAHADYEHQMYRWQHARPFRGDRQYQGRGGPRLYHSDMADWMLARPKWANVMEQTVHGVGAEMGTLNIAIGLAVRAIVAFGGAIWNVVKVASRFTETMARNDAVFGTRGKAVYQAAEEMSIKHGIPREMFLRAAGTIGTELQSAGIGGQANSQMAAELAKVGVELASLHDIEDVDTVLHKIISGLAGMPKPLRELGVNMTESMTKAKAYAMGIAQVGEELTEAQKYAARTVVVLEQSALALGDIERSAGRFSYELKKMAGQWEELKTHLGVVFAPIVSFGMRLVNFVMGLANGFLRLRNYMADFWYGLFGIGDKKKDLEKFDKLQDEAIKSTLEEQALATQGAEKKKRAERASHHDLVGFYKHLQEMIFREKDDVQKKQLNVQANQLVIQQKLLNAVQNQNQKRAIAVATP